MPTAEPDIEMDDEYPSEEGIVTIETWEPTEGFDYMPLLRAIQRVWRWPSYFRLTARRAYVSTGGWSGHEDMLNALERNHMFWTLHYLQHRRGGHFIFDLRTSNRSRRERWKSKHSSG